MNQDMNKLNNLLQKDGFRLRGTDMTRLETFMDAAFAFATTMLVISVGEIPKNYPELILAMKEIPSFLASFLVMMLFWMEHRKWSRWYGLEDGTTITISISLIFVLLVYIYPLRLMFSALFSWLSGGWLPSRFVLTHRDELIGLFVIYGIGLAAMAGLLALLFIRAKSARAELSLNGLEIRKTETEIVSLSIVATSGIVSALWAWTMPPDIDLFAGFIYAVLPIVIPLVERRFKKRETMLLISTDEDSETDDANKGIMCSPKDEPERAGNP